MIRAAILFVISVNSISFATTISEECANNPMFRQYYRQQNYSTESHQEDMILASLGKRYSESLLSVLKIKELDSEARKEQEEWIQKNCYPFVDRISMNNEKLSSDGEFLNIHEIKKVGSIRSEQI